MIIGLSGLKNSGKDTVGAYLVKEHGFERRSFADKLKESVAALFGTSPGLLDQLKNDPDALIQIRSGEATFSSSTMRGFLQRYGTEAHRDVFGEDFWVDQLLAVGGYYAGRAIVVTDVRFKNEAQRVIDLDGHIVIVERPGLDLQDPHRSEQEMLGISGYRLQNDGTVYDLYQSVEQMLVHLSDE